MLITHTPISLPVNTANHAVESLASEAVTKPQIPASNPTESSAQSKNSTEFAEQQKPTANDVYTKERASQEKQQNNDNEEAQDHKKGDFSDDSHQLELAEQKEVTQLQARDNEVRAHEQAHAAVGGSLAGSPNFSYTTGPDGKRYVTSGEVSIDVSKVANDPEATIQKLEQVQRAALAPANPSAQDHKVAAAASAGVNQARAEITARNVEQPRDGLKESNNSDNGENIRVGREQLNSDLNPIKAKRELNALQQKIQDSGAFESQSISNQLSLIA